MLQHANVANIEMSRCFIVMSKRYYFWRNNPIILKNLSRHSSIIKILSSDKNEFLVESALGSTGSTGSTSYFGGFCRECFGSLFLLSFGVLPGGAMTTGTRRSIIIVESFTIS